MNLATAKHYAEKIVLWLGPHCQVTKIAGSIRRERPECADVDIVCIPRITVENDMLGTPIARTNHVLAFLRDYVKASNGVSAFHSGDEHEGKQVIVQLPKCQLDLWFATPANFGTRLLCRTGSKEHNILLAQRAQELGGSWNPYEGVTLNGQLLPATAEQEVYDALKLPWIEPRDREGGFVARLMKREDGRSKRSSSLSSLPSPAL